MARRGRTSESIFYTETEEGAVAVLQTAASDVNERLDKMKTKIKLMLGCDSCPVRDEFVEVRPAIGGPIKVVKPNTLEIRSLKRRPGNRAPEVRVTCKARAREANNRNCE